VAVEEVEGGMIVGLVSGSTDAFAVDALAVHVAEGLRVARIRTSEKTAALAQRFGVPLTGFAKHRRIGIAIDGADKAADGTFDLVKGLGAALLREKIVTSAGDRKSVVVDETKLAACLGGNTPLSAEIVSLGFPTPLNPTSRR